MWNFGSSNSNPNPNPNSNLANQYQYDDDEYDYDDEYGYGNYEDKEFEHIPAYDSNSRQIFPQMDPWGFDEIDQNSRPPLYSPNQPPTPRYAVHDPIGLASPFLLKFWFEDLDHVDDAEFYPDNEMNRFMAQFFQPDPNPRQLVERFLKQVRESGGYDVDCMPPPMFNSPFSPIDLENCSCEHYNTMVQVPLSFAIHQINAQTGRTYELVDVVRAVMTASFFVFLTFTAADVGGGVVQTFRALVNSSPFHDEKRLVEWKIMGGAE